MKPRPLSMLLWTLLASLPIYAWGIYDPIQGLPFGLPGTAVMIVVPALLASAMAYQEGARQAFVALWRRVFDIERLTIRWTAIAVLAMPQAALGAYVVMWAAGRALPEHPTVNIALLPLAFALYFPAAILEEVGWTGYATEPLQQRFGVLAAGLIVGAVWVAWHLIPYMAIQHRPLAWVASQSLMTILMRVVMGYIYAHGGRSLLLAILFHTMINVSGSLFPNDGSHFDPIAVSVVLGTVIGAYAIASAGLTRSR